MIKFKKAPNALRNIIRRVEGRPTKRLVKKAASKAVALVLNKEETKQTITTLALTTMTQTPTIGLLFNIARATASIADVSGNNVRLGTKVTLMDVNIRGAIVNGAVTTASSGRIIIFRDKAINGVIGTAGQLMLDTSATYAFVSPFNLNNAKRFKILMDKRFSINNTGGATDQSPIKLFRCRKRYKKGTILQYNGGTANTVADCISGQLFYCFISDAAAGGPGILWTVDVKFKDA